MRLAENKQSVQSPMKHGFNRNNGFFVRLFLPALLIAGSIQADTLRTVNIFSPRRAGELNAAWRAGPGAPAVQADYESPAGIRFPCPFRNDISRVFWDRTVALDLSQYTLLELDLSCTHPDAIRSLGLYLKSGQGWYLWLPALKASGRQKLRFQLHDAATEGRPKGWNAINGIRISFTKGSDINAQVIIHALRVRTCDVVIVQATKSVPNSKEGNAARRTASLLSRWLNEAGVPHAMLDDQAVIKGRLRTGSGRTRRSGASAKVAILPYNPAPPRQELRALSSFVKHGGKLIVFYSAEPRLAKIMNMRLGDYQAASRPGQWSRFAFNRHAPPHTPRVISQESRNIRPVYPADSSARVIATWQSAAGKTLSDPAWVQSDQGFWMSHILMDGDSENKKKLLLALLGFLDHSIWRDTAEHAWFQSGKVSSFHSLAASLAGIRRLDKRQAAKSLLIQVKADDERLRSCMAQGKYPEAVNIGQDLNSTLIRAYARVQHPRYPEFRGVWNHSGTGLYPGNWNATCRILSQSGITAVFPNLAWAGTAQYPSRIVPPSYIAKTYGDQLKQSTTAAHRYGLELHAWKVCWNLGSAPDALVSRLRRAGRLQKTDKRKTLEWLCPSHPDNITHELNIISELISRADVDGIHLDYVRYPSTHACFCGGCQKRFEKWLGRSVRGWPNSVKSGTLKDAFSSWRAAQMTGFIRSARDLIRRRKPDVKLSVAVYRNYPQCTASIGQDWGRWLKEGLVDFVCPMDYTEDNASFYAQVRQQTRLPKAGRRVFPGIGVTAVESRLAPDEVIDQILRTRDAGTGGFMLFDLNHTLEKDILPILSLGITRTNR